jgi:hypothetical protein
MLPAKKGAWYQQYTRVVQKHTREMLRWAAGPFYTSFTAVNKLAILPGMTKEGTQKKV